MEKKGWKILAIVFIILFILETLLVGWLLSLGSSMIEDENECSINICSDYEKYYYDSSGKICYCFTDGEIAYTEFIN